MSTFDPNQHPRGNTVTGHAGQFAVKEQTSAETTLDVGHDAYAGYLSQVWEDYGVNLSPDLADRFIRERLQDDFRDAHGQDELERVMDVPISRVQGALDILAADVSERDSSTDTHDKRLSRRLIGALEQQPVGTRLDFKNDHPDGRWRPHWILRPGERKWQPADSLIPSDLVAEGIESDSWLAAAGASTSIDEEEGIGRLELTSTGAASGVYDWPSRETVADAAPRLIAQMIRQDQRRGFVEEEPAADLYAHIDPSVYRDEVIDQLHLADADDLPEGLWDEVRNQL
ncbi:hypothetical protein [Pseudoclavibacter soli]|uniref:hypothetical protein n=1 Tax=Pseudoclavibacter soli TaxID=452623 RepID=UPI000400AF43|nr:hypothetical protein [Pseudoclavibacter soli]